MSLTLINKAEFNEKIESGKVLVTFSSPTCGPCMQLQPVLAEVSESRTDLNIYKVDISVGDNRDLAISLGIKSVPTLIFFENGTEVKRNIGFLGKPDILSKIEVF